MASRPVSTASAAAYNIPLPPGDDGLLDPPQPAFLGFGSSVASRTSVVSDNSHNSGPLIPPTVKNEAIAEKEVVKAGQEEVSPVKKRRGPVFWLICLAALIGLVLVIILPVYFTVIKPNQKTSNATSTGPDNSNSGNNSGGDNPLDPDPKPSGAITGGDGSTVTMEDGSTFIYDNKFGGVWVADPKDPFNNNAYPNSWTPPLNTSWRYGSDKIYGVNLGGLFVLEPFISPALFQKYPGTIDEWTLCEAMAADREGGGVEQLEEHYKTFITEEDIAEIAGSGLNWIRLPVPYWAIDTWEGEPFLAKVSWKYIVRILDWCRKYGLRVNLDLHTIPGSQNAFNHSGKFGGINFLNGVMGYANAQRALNYIRIFTEFITQPEYKDVVPMFSIMNEPVITVIGKDGLTSFYIEAHRMIREITGYGEGSGPYIILHDSFRPNDWVDYLPGADRVGIDTHPYFAFSGATNREPLDTGTGPDAGGQWPGQVCRAWGPRVRSLQTTFGVSFAGEFSNGYNDCGLFLRGVRGSANYGDCTEMNNYKGWTRGFRAGVRAFAEASIDTFGNWFFWTWKIGNSLTSGEVESPLWSYKLGLAEGWMPKDPRTAEGKCSRIGIGLQELQSTFQPYMTGGAGAGSISPALSTQFPWPPVAIANAPGAIGQLPFYAPTGVVSTLPPATYTAFTHTLDGWFNSQDTAGAPTPVTGCIYAESWNAETAALPPPCVATITTTAIVTDPAITAPPTGLPVRRGLRFQH